MIDERTFQLTLIQPDGNFLAYLAHPIASVLKRDNVENWEVDWDKWEEPTAILAADFTADKLPVGTGPFKLEKFEFLGNLELARNEHYYGESAKLDAVEFITDLGPPDISDLVIAEGMAFDALKIDAMTVSPRDVAKLENEFGDDAAKLQPYHALPVTEFLVFNSALPTLDNSHFRRALVLSADVGLLAERLGREPAKRVITPDLSENDDATVELLGFDADLAAEELKMAIASGASPDNDQVLFHTWATGDFMDEFETIASDWEEHLGITAEYRSISPDDYEKIVDAGDLQMKRITVTASFPSPASIWNEVDLDFGTPDRISEDAAVAIEMLREAATEPDVAVSNQLYTAAEQYLIDNALLMPLFWHRGELMHRLQPWVHDFRVPKYGGSKFKAVWFDETAPER